MGEGGGNLNKHIIYLIQAIMEYFWGKVHMYKRTDTLPDGLPSVHLKLRTEDYFDIEIHSDDQR
jgi:hypothetical protein